MVRLFKGLMNRKLGCIAFSFNLLNPVLLCCGNSIGLYWWRTATYVTYKMSMKHSTTIFGILPFSQFLCAHKCLVNQWLYTYNEHIEYCILLHITNNSFFWITGHIIRISAWTLLQISHQNKHSELYTQWNNKVSEWEIVWKIYGLYWLAGVKLPI